MFFQLSLFTHSFKLLLIRSRLCLNSSWYKEMSIAQLKQYISLRFWGLITAFFDCNYLGKDMYEAPLFKSIFLKWIARSSTRLYA